MGKKIILAELQLDTQGIMKAAAETRKQMEELEKQQQKLIEKGKENSRAYGENATALAQLTAIQKAQQAALGAQVNQQQRLLSQMNEIQAGTAKINQTETDYIANNQQLIALKKTLNTSDQDYQQKLALINAKLMENNNWLKENGSEHGKLVTTMNDYKSKVMESFDSINIFNGGLSGMISRAQEAGGTGPLVANAFSGMANGIMGMTRASLSFIATPFGMVLAAIAVVIALVQNAMDRNSESAGKITKIFSTFSVISDKLLGLLEPLGSILIDGIAAGFEMAGKAAEAAMGWIADGLSFLGFEEGAEEVRGFTKEIKDTAAETENLKKAQEALAAQQAVQEINNEKAKQQADELRKKAEDQTLSEHERRAALQQTAQVEKDNMAEKKKLADEAYMQAIRQIALDKRLTQDEIENLRNGGAAYAEKMMRVKGYTQEEIETLKKAQLDKMKITGEEKQMLQRHDEDKLKMDAEYEARRAAARQQREREEQDRKRKAQEALADSASLKKLELDGFLLAQQEKEKSLESELADADAVYKKKMEIAAAEFEAGKKDAVALQERKNAEMKADIEMKAERANITAQYAKAEADLWVAQHHELLTENKNLTAELVDQKREAFDGETKLKIDALARENEIDQELLRQKIANNMALSAEETRFLAGVEQLNIENNDRLEALDDTFRQQQAANRAVELEIARAQADTEYEQQVAEEEIRHQAEDAKLIERKEQGLITEAQYNALSEAENKKHADNKKAIEKSVMDNKLSLASTTFGNLAAIMGKESAAGKAMAVAQATIDTYKSAVSAYSSMSGIPVVGPALGAVAAAAAVAAGIANIKKITSTKAPKAEKGALFGIGGKRHSQGGTMFTGEDGTRFEAEQGELIGVMNRNAARHFMAFNNAFPAGRGAAPNYFASGGIVSREIAPQGLNTDELAAKLAQANRMIPAPVVAVEDILSKSSSHVQVRDAANF